MSPFEGFELYLALKLHFTTDSYDYTKYNGKVKTASTYTFERRSDKWEFVRLSKHKDPFGLIVSNFIVSYHKIPWIGDITKGEGSERKFVEWQRRNQTLTYFALEQISEHVFEQEKPFKELVPQISLCALQYKLAPETFIILDSITKIGSLPNSIDPTIWELYMRMIRKYRALDPLRWLEFKKKFTPKLVDHFKSLKYTP